MVWIFLVEMLIVFWKSIQNLEVFFFCQEVEVIDTIRPLIPACIITTVNNHVKLLGREVQKGDIGLFGIERKYQM